jgi:S-adenosylmethionine:tRNA ribosyltransferase-isomerase
MKTSDFKYDLPEELIAQTPLLRRDASRLMLLSKSGEELNIRHRIFSELPTLLREGDCLVFNDSRVLPARLFGKRISKNTVSSQPPASDCPESCGKQGMSGGGAVEVLLLTDKGEGVWECLTRPGRKTPVGTQLVFGGGELKAEVVGAVSDGNKLLKFKYEGIFLEILERLGNMPLPPYIKEELKDSERYQTVYSKETGSAAAPTAGLHFTPELLKRLEDKGVELEFVTLHVGLGTFRPVKTEEITDHEMHAEYCRISKQTAENINRAKREGRRIIACGTTSCRTLEAVSDINGFVREFSGWVNIFIYPGYTFKCIDGLITNFHLPESTLLMLVSALAGREKVLKAYETAVRERYRFFSFGDAMLIL